MGDGPARPSADASAGTDAVEVATSCDRAYLPYAAALAGSIARSRAAGTAVRLMVLHAGVTQDEQRRLAAGAPGIDIHWAGMSRERYEQAGLPTDALVLTPHYFRCLLPDVLGPDVRRALYLDADMIVLADLAGLSATDLGGLPVGAVQDCVSTIGEAIAPWCRLGLDPDARYFNSGMLLMDLDLWRADGIGQAAMRHCLADREHLALFGRWQEHDQYGLNVVLHQRWRELAPTWNHFSDHPARSPNIVHFLGDAKPGSVTCRPAFTRAFARAIDATEWAGWRPPTLRPGWSARFTAAAVVRAARRAVHRPRRRSERPLPAA
jgi:lipopolysaccharide biosynthesis glycosyltransferase